VASSTPPQSLRVFLIVWFGQLVSLVGSGLTSFALGVWTYQRTQSVTQFALITFFAALPGIVLSPLAGALVDRWDRRKTMMASDTCSALGTLAIALLLMSGSLESWHIYLVVAVNSACSAFQIPAYSAAVTMMVPREQLNRANGLLELAQSAVPIIAPLLAGMLVVWINLQGVILIDFATFLFSILTLSLVRIAHPEMSAEGAEAQGSLLREAAFGWKYIAARPGLLGLLLFFAAVNLSYALSEVLTPPLVLKIASPATLGTVLAVGGAGLVAGSFAIAAWQGPRKRVLGVLGGGICFGLSLMATGVRPSIPLIMVAVFMTMLWIPLVNAWSRSIWQVKVAPDLQGRIFATRMAIAWSTTPIGYLLAGPLADRIFEPWMRPDGALASSVGQVLGTGEGRGIGLLFVVLGLLPALAGSAGLLHPRIRNVEEEIPDYPEPDAGAEPPVPELAPTPAA
jgi:MFS family permease